MTYGKNQSINLGNDIDVQFTATGNSKTNKSGSYAPNIQDLPAPKGAVRNATLFMYTCHSADSQKEAHGEVGTDHEQGALSGSGKSIAQVFSETFRFKAVQGTAGAVNYHSLLTDGTPIWSADYLEPYPQNGKWVRYYPKTAKEAAALADKANEMLKTAKQTAANAEIAKQVAIIKATKAKEVELAEKNPVTKAEKAKEAAKAAEEAEKAKKLANTTKVDAANAEITAKEAETTAKKAKVAEAAKK